MSETDSQTTDLIIQIPEGLWDKKPLEPIPTFRIAQHQILKRIGVELFLGLRETPQGEIHSQTLQIPMDQNRTNVLALFQNSALYAVLPRILQHIYAVGLDPDKEMRHYAAAAIAELKEHLSLLELVEQCVGRWAVADQLFEGKRTAALTFTLLLAKKSDTEEIFSLLCHWAGSGNLRLGATTLIVCHNIYESYPEQTLAIIERIVLTGNLPLTKSASLVLHRLYALYPPKLIDQLFKWFDKDSDRKLRLFSASWFLNAVELRDLKIHNITDERIADYIYTLWEKGIERERKQWQRPTTIALKSWAITVLMPSNDEDSLETYQPFFIALDQKYTNMPENRLRYHLGRWQAQADHLDAQLPKEEQHNLNFFSLIKENRPIT